MDKHICKVPPLPISSPPSLESPPQRSRLNQKAGLSPSHRILSPADHNQMSKTNYPNALRLDRIQSKASWKLLVEQQMSKTARMSQRKKNTRAFYQPTPKQFYVQSMT